MPAKDYAAAAALGAALGAALPVLRAAVLRFR
jgi:hypothetical protein